MSFDFSKFIKSPEFDVEIVVVRNAFHMERADHGKSDPEYIELSSTIFFRKDDLKKFDLSEGDTVEVSRNGRSVRMTVKIDETAPEGMAMIFNSIYASQLSSMSDLKRFNAKIKKVEGKPTELDEILKMFEKK